jgi:hypothetical protein
VRWNAGAVEVRKGRGLDCDGDETGWRRRDVRVSGLGERGEIFSRGSREVITGGDRGGFSRWTLF